MGFLNTSAGASGKTFERDFIDDGSYIVRFLGASEPRMFKNNYKVNDKQPDEIETSYFNFEVIGGNEGQYNGCTISKAVNINASVAPAREGSKESTLRQVLVALAYPAKIEELPDFADFWDFVKFLIGKECKALISVKASADGSQSSIVKEFKPRVTTQPTNAPAQRVIPQPQRQPVGSGATPQGNGNGYKNMNKNFPPQQEDTEDSPF